MSGAKSAFLVAFVCVLMLLAAIWFAPMKAEEADRRTSVGTVIIAHRAFFVTQPMAKGSSLPLAGGLAILCGGLFLLVVGPMLLVIRRTSGGILRQTQGQLQNRGVPGMEALRRRVVR